MWEEALIMCDSWGIWWLKVGALPMGELTDKENFIF